VRTTSKPGEAGCILFCAKEKAPTKVKRHKKNDFIFIKNGFNFFSDNL
jgi:hypothetical protein